MTTKLQAPSSKLQAAGSCRLEPAACSLQRAAYRGFSLIEVVISMAVLAVGIVGAIRVFPVGLRASQRSELSSRATIAAERTLESWKLKSWDELTAGDTASREDPFDITVTVDQPTVEGLIDPTRLKRVSVKIGWQQDGRSRALTVVTYVHRPSA